MRVKTVILGVLLVAFSFGIDHYAHEIKTTILPAGKSAETLPVWPTASDVDFDVASALHVHSADDVRRVRSDLLHLIFKTDSLPDISAEPGTAADLSKTGIDFKVPGARWLTYEMRYDFVSNMLYLPNAGAKCLFIFGDGHAEQVLSHKPISYPLLGDIYRRGCSELIISMPLRGHNPRPVVEVPGIGTISTRAGAHDTLAILQSRDFHPLSLFMAPVLAGVNYLTTRNAYDFIAMSGISGGGWTTTLYAALDPRIDLSAVVADSAPMYLRLMDKRSMGDWEQTAPDVYAIASYLDLYVMDTSAGRTHVQILNVADDCCFGGTAAKSYAGIVATAAGRLGGSYRLRLDYTATEHQITGKAVSWITGAVNAGLGK